MLDHHLRPQPSGAVKALFDETDKLAAPVKDGSPWRRHNSLDLGDDNHHDQRAGL
jgi:hypothetical protein